MLLIHLDKSNTIINASILSWWWFYLWMDFVDSLKSSDIQTAAAGRENTFCSYLTHHLCKLVFIVFLVFFFFMLKWIPVFWLLCLICTRLWQFGGCFLSSTVVFRLCLKAKTAWEEESEWQKHGVKNYFLLLFSIVIYNYSIYILLVCYVS